jgi:hypothetical protein
MPVSALAAALAAPRSVLFEHELLAFFAGLGLRVPAFAFVPGGRELEPAGSQQGQALAN